MNDDQITALAREYAEEGAEDVGLPNCLQNETFGLVVTETECVIKWLLRRFCLVEKSKVEEAYKACASMRDDNLSPNIESAILHHRGVEGVRVLKSLFPEIAKEVGV